MLDAERQAYGHERGVDALGRKLIHGQLGELAGKAGVDPPADAQHKALGAAGLEVVLEESDAPCDFLRRGDGGLDAQFVNDRGLKFTHDHSLLEDPDRVSTFWRAAEHRRRSAARTASKRGQFWLNLDSSSGGSRPSHFW